jgi:hypothetical protein
MKITGFNPAILTSDLESVIHLFEDLGFQQKHARDGIASESVDDTVEATIRLKNEDGFAIDINKANGFPRDVTLIRINVDDFDEAYKLLEERGFCNCMGEGNLIVSPYIKGAHMASPSGFEVMLMQHLKG